MDGEMFLGISHAVPISHSIFAATMMIKLRARYHYLLNKLKTEVTCPSSNSKSLP